MLVMAQAGPNRVRSTRVALGLSQATLAATTRLSRQSIGAIEAGRATPAVDVALRIAAALDSSVEDLFGVPHVETARSATVRRSSLACT